MIDEPRRRRQNPNGDLRKTSPISSCQAGNATSANWLVADEASADRVLCARHYAPAITFLWSAIAVIGDLGDGG